MKYYNSSKLVDIKTAILHGELKDDELVFMDCPDGMEHEPNKCLRPNKTERAFIKKFTNVLLIIGFLQSRADPCVMVRRNKLGVIYMALYVDGIYTKGDDTELEDAIIGLRKHFKINVVNDLTDYLSFEIRLN
jgi:hypothetical protein